MLIPEYLNRECTYANTLMLCFFILWIVDGVLLPQKLMKRHISMCLLLVCFNVISLKICLIAKSSEWFCIPYCSILQHPNITQHLTSVAFFLQEALHREQMLEQKLALLQRLLLNSQDASEKGWQALIDEDRLLSRLEFLENQLQAYNKVRYPFDLCCHRCTILMIFSPKRVGSLQVKTNFNLKKCLRSYRSSSWCIH